MAGIPLLSIVFAANLLGATLGASTLSVDSRRRDVIADITFEYPAKYETLAQELAPLLVQLNNANAARSTSVVPTPITPLSVRDLRARRAEYLAQIAANIGLTEPTPLQIECYDAFLENFETCSLLWAKIASIMREYAAVRTVSIWEKTDLMARLKSGESIPGFSVDPDGERVNFNWSASFNRYDADLAGLMAAREKRRLDYGYNFTVKDGIASIAGSFRARPAHPSAMTRAPTPNPGEPESGPPMAVPIVLRPEDLETPIKDLAAAQILRVQQGLVQFAAAKEDSFQNPATMAYLILHETAEVGIVERYLGSSDRRWLCDGMANYVAWKVVHDRFGPDLARQVYDLDAQLKQYADLKARIDLRHWTAVESQKAEDAGSDNNKAHYAYATQAVSLIARRHGDDFLPRLFREIGRTPRVKTNMRVVEKAYRQLTKGDLSSVLADATK